MNLGLRKFVFASLFSTVFSVTLFANNIDLTIPTIASDIAVTGISFTLDGTISSGGTGKSAGKVTTSDIQVTKVLDKSSPKLFEAVSTGKHFKKVYIEMFKTGSSSPYYEITLDDALIASDQVDNSQNPEETLTLDFSSISWAYSADRSNPLAAFLPNSADISDGAFRLPVNITLDDFDSVFHDSDISADVNIGSFGVPEPGSLVLLVSGLLGLTLKLRRG